MTAESILGIDIGTSSAKAVLARPDGTVIAQAERPHAVSLPRPGWAEHDAEEIWWAAVVALCTELAPATRAGLSGICVSGIGPCVVLCDESLQPLRPAILYGIDTRASAEIDALVDGLGADEILQRTGSALSSQALGPKLLWLKRHEPTAWQRATGWYMASSFAVARLTGAYVLDHQSASQCNPFYDLRSSSWAHDWAAELIPEMPLPELAWPGDQVGTVTADAARETGLPAGTPVMAGTVDAWAEAFSVGVRRPGELMLMYGSTMFFVQVADEPKAEALLWVTQGVEPGTKTLAAGMSTSGALTQWVRELAGGPAWEELVREAETVPAGARGLLLLPYFAGERTPIFDPRARGVAAGLTLRHGRAELLRAAYEATAYGVRQILDMFAATARPPERVVAVGGGTHSDLWLRIVGEITGVPQEVPKQTIGAAYGDALFAAIGSGLVEPDTDWAEIERVVQPTGDHAALYDELFELYGDLYTSTATIVHRLADLAAADRL